MVTVRYWNVNDSRAFDGTKKINGKLTIDVTNRLEQHYFYFEYDVIDKIELRQVS